MKDVPPSAPPVPAAVRVDIWLDVVCLFKTRSEAQRALRAGQVSMDGVPVKPHRPLHVGDKLDILRPSGRLQTIVVLGLVDQNVSKAEARLLYDDVTPPPSPEEIEGARMDRLLRDSLPHPVTTPHRRDRRTLRRLRRVF